MIIVDTGPLVALFDASEPSHARCKETLKKITAPLSTTWPVLTEAFYLLGDWKPGQDKLWDFIMAGGITPCDIPESHYGRLRALMEKYSDNPMDLADAMLVVLAEIHKARKVFTLDRKDFSRYRPRHCLHFEILP